MKISTLIYCTKEACAISSEYLVFTGVGGDYFGMYFPVLYVFGLIANVQYMVRNAESTVGITVFFNEDMSEDDIQKIGMRYAPAMRSRK